MSDWGIVKESDRRMRLEKSQSWRLEIPPANRLFARLTRVLVVNILDYQCYGSYVTGFGFALTSQVEVVILAGGEARDLSPADCQETSLSRRN